MINIKNALFSALSKFVKTKTGIVVTGSTRLQGNCQFDEIDFVELFVKIDSEFCFDFPDEDADHIIKNDSSVSEIIDMMSAVVVSRSEIVPEWKKNVVADLEKLQISVPNLKRKS